MIEETTDSAAGTFAAEIATQIVWDSATAVRAAAGRIAIRVPIGFMVSDAGAPAILDSIRDVTTEGLQYLISRTDSISPAVAEAVVAPPDRLSGSPPVYPRELQMAGEEGKVVVEAVVDTLGRVEPASVRVVSSTNHGFDGSARHAVERWKYRVVRTPWHAIEVRIRVPIIYTMVR